MGDEIGGLGVTTVIILGVIGFVILAAAAVAAVSYFREKTAADETPTVITPDRAELAEAERAHQAAYDLPADDDIVDDRRFDAVSTKALGDAVFRNDTRNHDDDSYVNSDVDTPPSTAASSSENDGGEHVHVRRPSAVVAGSAAVAVGDDEAEFSTQDDDTVVVVVEDDDDDGEYDSGGGDDGPAVTSVGVNEVILADQNDTQGEQSATAEPEPETR
jgi:hypothetical protein